MIVPCNSEYFSKKTFVHFNRHFVDPGKSFLVFLDNFQVPLSNRTKPIEGKVFIFAQVEKRAEREKR